MTRLFGVIGSPIGHSLSPAMHAAALEALGLDACYTAIEVPPAHLGPMLRALVLAGVEGLNVTVPLKARVLPLLDRVDPTARAIGAVNTIVVRDRATTGYNTDGVGFLQALRELGWRPGPVRAVVLGAGGSARAVAWELTGIAGSDVLIANRHPARAQQLVRWLVRARSRSRVRAVPLAAVPVKTCELLVNATTVGMDAAADEPLIDPTALPRGAFVYDLVYHRTSSLVRAARRRGCVAADGRSMLLYQGAASLRLWLARRPPIEVMRRALNEVLGRR